MVLLPVLLLLLLPSTVTTFSLTVTGPDCSFKLNYYLCLKLVVVPSESDSVTPSISFSSSFPFARLLNHSPALALSRPKSRLSFPTPLSTARLDAHHVARACPQPFSLCTQNSAAKAERSSRSSFSRICMSLRTGTFFEICAEAKWCPSAWRAREEPRA